MQEIINTVIHLKQCFRLIYCICLLFVSLFISFSLFFSVFGGPFRKHYCFNLVWPTNILRCEFAVTLVVFGWFSRGRVHVSWPDGSLSDSAEHGEM